MAANRIKKGSVSRLPSVTVLVNAYITHHDNSQDIMYVKADDGNDTFKKIKNKSTSINNKEIKLDEFNTTITGSEKCDSLTPFLSHPGNIKYS